MCREHKPDGDFNREHVVPEAIGGSLVIYDVCTACNSILGHSVDAKLIETPQIQLARLSYGLIDGDGRHFFQTGTLSDDPTQSFNLSLYPGGEQPAKICFVPNVEREPIGGEEDGERISISVDAADMDKLPLMLNKMLRRKGLSEMEPEEILKLVQRRQIQNPTTSHSAVFHLDNWRPAMVKIAYEFTYYCIESAYLSDPVSQALSSAIMDTDMGKEWYERHRLRGSIETTGSDPESVAYSDPHKHQLLLVPHDGRLACNVKIFNLFEASLEVASSDFSDQGFVGRLLVMDALKKIVRRAYLTMEYGT